MKKGIILFFALFLANTISATGSYDNPYTPPETNTQYELQAKVIDNSVLLSWIPVAKMKAEGFVYYKVVRSQKNASPVYPDDGYIEYSSDISFSSFTDPNPPTGKMYYRVCAIYDTDDTGKKPRICSNVVSVTRESLSKDNIVETKKYQEQKTYVEPKKTENSTNSNLTQSVKKRLDSLLANFQNSLNKREITNSEKGIIIDKAINRYSTLATKTKIPATKKMAKYMVEKLELMKSQYTEDDTSEIENMLSDL